MTTVRDVQHFRGTLDAFVEDFLRLRGDIADTPESPPGGSEMQGEEYQALRRDVDNSFRAVEESFVTFVRTEPEYDLRHTDYFGLDDVDDVHADFPITSWWRPLTLGEALDEFANVDAPAMRGNLRRQHAVLDAFSGWIDHQPEPQPSPLGRVPAANPQRSVTARGGLAWINNPWLVTIGGTVIATLLVLAILAFFAEVDLATGG